MKRLFLSCFAAVAVMVVAACGAIPGNSQVNAGITHAVVEVCATDDNTPYVCEAEIIDGKDKQNVSLDISNPAGWKVTYTASGVQAVEAIKVRGAVEQAVSEDLKDAAPGIVGTITEAVIEALSP